MAGCGAPRHRLRHVGGDHRPDWPAEVQDLLRRALAAGYTCAFAANESLRLFGKRLDRSQVRRWALATGLVHPYVWPDWIRVMVGPRGVVQWNGLCMPTQCRHGERPVVCDHLDGTVSVLRREPNRDEIPVVLFTNRVPRR